MLPDADYDVHEFFTHVFSACFLRNNIPKRPSTRCVLMAGKTSRFSMGSNYCVSRVVEL